MTSSKFRRLLFSAAILLLVPPATAQILTYDLQSFLQMAALRALGEKQTDTLGSVLQINTDHLQTAQKINDALGSRNFSQLTDMRCGDLQTLLRTVPGLENVEVAKLFPPNVAGAFLGRSFGEWKDMIGNPTGVMANELRRLAIGDLVHSAGAKTEEAAFLDYATGGGSGQNRDKLALGLSRMLTARLLESVSTQAEQTAVYAAEKDRFSEDAKKDLTLTDRARLTNNQGTLSLELQLQQLQAQSMAQSAQAVQLDAQTRLMEQQIAREEVDRASRSK